MQEDNFFIIKTANESVKDGFREVYRDNSLEELLELVKKYADEHFDGHYSIYSFTTNYKVIFGTINETRGVWKVEGFPTLKEALIYSLVEKPDGYTLEYNHEEYMRNGAECDPSLFYQDETKDYFRDTYPEIWENLNK